ncbi:adenine deaminase [Crassaminicella profunda]|uniref:adenine deaminase n=1 Tax=Crassaminicella profunda TaxID=1286698 RepID=UPI001CA6C8CF|nr:adenine deaminase [Crassaminicella profunda]QZY56068.1 adenine deaminase [Crassaminicella profunda]
MQLLPKDKKGLIESAVGKRVCDLVIENAQIVNVFTGEIYKGNVGIYDGFIAHIQSDPDHLNREEAALVGKKYYDAKGEYLIPGFVDAHIHIESTMMTPRNFAKAVIPHGTTTVVTDPHEIANVCGIEAVEYMHESSKDIPMRQYILAPSCVPAVPGKENAGAVFMDKEIKELLEMDRVIGLAEVMDYLGVINNDKRMVDILDCVEQKNLFMQGHAPFVSGRELSAYLCAGPNSDHESRIGQEARDKMRAGMYVDARESSISKNVEEIIKNIKDFRYLNYLTFCTDDREPEDILESGHMNDVVRKAIGCGMHPIDAIRSATLNVAKEIGVKNLGAIAPGYVADLVIINSLEDLIPTAVFFEGTLVAEKGELKVEVEDKDFNIEDKNTVFIDNLKVEDFRMKAPIENGKIKTNIIKYQELNFSTTDFVVEELPVKNGYIDLSHDPDLKFVIVINRHKGHNTKGYGIVRNFGTQVGTVGSTVSHDCHNLTIVYDTPENGYIVAKDLIEIGGGLSCAKNDERIEHLALPIGGLISKKPCKVLAKESTKMKDALRGLGLTEIENPLLRIATLALPVIPNAKMSDLGMIDVLTQEVVDLFNE